MTQIFTQFIQGIFWQDSFSNDDSTSVWCLSELRNIRNSAEKSQFKVLYSLFTGNIVSRIDKCLFHVPATIMGTKWSLFMVLLFSIFSLLWSGVESSILFGHLIPFVMVNNSLVGCGRSLCNCGEFLSLHKSHKILSFSEFWLDFNLEIYTSLGIICKCV